MRIITNCIISVSCIFFLCFSHIANAECIEGQDGCMFGWNSPLNTTNFWDKWTWLNPMSEFGGRGFMMDIDNPMWFGPALNWANGGRIRSFSKGANGGGPIYAELDTQLRAPSTSTGASFKVYDDPSASGYAASWWMWYDANTLSARGITDEDTDRMSFYMKTENMNPLSTSGGVYTWGYHVGTYLCRDSCRDGEGPGNQHYYHYLAVNPGAWLHIELDQHPQHRRQGSGPVAGNNPSWIEAGKNYFEHMSRFYMEIRRDQENPTTMHIDELKYYSTKDSVEPDQNEESVTSVWVGNWGLDDYWEIGFSDSSYLATGMNDHTWSTFEIKWSENPITNENYDQATLVEPMFYTGPEYTDGRVGAIRRASSYAEGVWTRFELPDEVENEGNQIYFAIKDISINGTGGGTKYPYNRLDGHDAPTNNIRIIDYHIGPDIINPIVFETQSLRTVNVQDSYSEQVDVTGGVKPYNFSTVSDLPDGMTFSSEGLLSGIPTEIGIFPVTIELRDSNTPQTIQETTLVLNVYPQEVCNDAIDNDNDGLTDCSDADCIEGCSELLVDFGDSEENNIFGSGSWNTVFHDGYTGYLNQGITNIVSDHRDYNFQGISGSGRLFSNGDKIVTKWYNNHTNSITFTPRISIIESGRSNDRSTGWEFMSNITILPGDYGLSEYIFTGSTVGEHTFINTNVNYTHNSDLILDKILYVPAYVEVEEPQEQEEVITDTTFPVISDGLPVGELSQDTRNVIFSIQTDEEAYCKYSTQGGGEYDSMLFLSTTGSGSHNQNISVQSGTEYNYYIKCSDLHGNINIVDYVIYFSTAQEDIIPEEKPIIKKRSGGGGGKSSRKRKIKEQQTQKKKNLLKNISEIRENHSKVFDKSSGVFSNKNIPNEDKEKIIKKFNGISYDNVSNQSIIQLQDKKKTRIFNKVAELFLEKDYGEDYKQKVSQDLNVVIFSYDILQSSQFGDESQKVLRKNLKTSLNSLKSNYVHYKKIDKRKKIEQKRLEKAYYAKRKQMILEKFRKKKKIPQ